MNTRLLTSLLRLIGAQVSVHACMTGVRMAAPLMALRQGYGPVAVGVLIALFALAQVFLALPDGRYAQRHGLHRPMRLAAWVATPATLLAVAWPTFGVLCATALACGAATGLAMITLQRHVGLMAQGPAELRQVFSWLALGPSVSNFLGPMLTGVLIDTWGFRAAYLLAALLPPLALWWIWRVPELPGRTQEEGAPSGGRRSSWDLLRLPGFAGLMVVNWLLASCWDVHTFLVPVIGHERGLSATLIGAILGAFALAATAVRLLIPVLAGRLQESRVIATAMLATAALFGLYPLVVHPWAMGALSMLLGVALGSVQPMVMSTLHQITPPSRHGEAIGLRAMAINGSSVVMPLLFGSAGTLVGAGVVFWCVGACVGLGARVAWRLPQGASEPERITSPGPAGDGC